VFLVEVFDLKPFLRSLPPGGRCHNDNDNYANDNGNYFEQEQTVLSEKFDHIEMPTLFFCKTCSAR